MRGLVVRQRLVKAAALAASAALLAACGAKAGPEPDGPPSWLAAGAAYTPGTALISDGTDTVLIGGVAVKFPTTVTDAAWSADGSRIAFIAADGNVATARLDGTGLVTVTSTAAGVVRSDPVWSDTLVGFTEVGADGTKRLKLMSPDVEPVKPTAYDWVTNEGPEVANSMPNVVAAPGEGYDEAFVHETSRGPEVWVADTNQRTPVAVRAVVGTEPALSPDGLHLAFVNGGHIHVASWQQGKAKAVQVSFDDAKPTHLAWTPAGDRIAYSTAAGVQSIAATVPAGARTNPPTALSTKPGIVTFLQGRQDTIVRITGADPVEIAINASQALYATSSRTAEFENSAQSASIVATAGAAAAFAPPISASGPLLFTSGPGLDQRTGAELRRLFGQPAPGEETIVSILGGPNGVPAQVDQTITDLGWKVERPASLPSGRGGGAFVVVVSDGDPGVLAALGQLRDALVLTITGSDLPAPMQTYLNSIGSDTAVYAVGAGAKTALAASWSGKHSTFTPTAIAGTSPAATIAQLNRRFEEESRTIIVADRGSPTDVALAVSVARRVTGVVVLLDHNAPPGLALTTWLSGASVRFNRMYIVDSAAAVSPATQAALATVIGGPLATTAESNPKAPQDPYRGG